jgi:hypothetical protein
MDSWHATFLGLGHLSRKVTAFEVEVFFQFSAEEARIIEERRRPEFKLGLALQMGFLRMSGRLLDGNWSACKNIVFGRGPPNAVTLPSSRNKRDTPNENPQHYLLASHSP